MLVNSWNDGSLWEPFLFLGKRRGKGGGVKSGECCRNFNHLA